MSTLYVWKRLLNRQRVLRPQSVALTFSHKKETARSNDALTEAYRGSQTRIHVNDISSFLS